MNMVDIDDKDECVNCDIDVRSIAQSLAIIDFFTNRIRSKIGDAGLRAELKKHEEQYKQERGWIG